MDYYQCIYDAISIHALREEGDGGISADDPNAIEFLSTPSARRATTTNGMDASKTQFLSTPSARRATKEIYAQGNTVDISIHALREEGDQHKPCQTQGRHDFYPRPPRGGRPEMEDALCEQDMISIHALREEGDPRSRSSHAAPRYFYPRPPRGGRPYGGKEPVNKTFISIHALREEGDVRRHPFRVP